MERDVCRAKDGNVKATDLEYDDWWIKAFIQTRLDCLTAEGKEGMDFTSSDVIPMFDDDDEKEKSKVPSSVCQIRAQAA